MLEAWWHHSQSCMGTVGKMLRWWFGKFIFHTRNLQDPSKRAYYSNSRSLWFPPFLKERSSEREVIWGTEPARCVQGQPRGICPPLGPSKLSPSAAYMSSIIEFLALVPNLVSAFHQNPEFLVLHHLPQLRLCSTFRTLLLEFSCWVPNTQPVMNLVLHPGYYRQGLCFMWPRAVWGMTFYYSYFHYLKDLLNINIKRSLK